MTMNPPDAAWEARATSLWKEIDMLDAAEFIARIDALVAELPQQSAIGLFERGAAQDSTGHPENAVVLYRAALSSGLTGIRRRRATIQLASSLRSLGDAQQAAELLTAELPEPSDELDGAVHAFLALALVDLGREREAVALSLTALSSYLPRYKRSLARYAEEIQPAPGRTDSDASTADDLGFTWRRRKNGEVEVLHRGRLASTLRSSDASEFLAEADAATFAEAQQLMARLTGNYKHGNERVATNHLRNRK